MRKDIVFGGNLDRGLCPRTLSDMTPSAGRGTRD